MQSLTVTITPLSAFGGPLQGDTLFGQLCWAARNRFGEPRLREMLEGYTGDRPFLVVSDAFPTAHVPRPAIPLSKFKPVPNADRKRVKKRHWFPLAKLEHPLADWLLHCKSDGDLAESIPWRAHSQPHNSIDRRTGTTGRGDFAPYSLLRFWPAANLSLQLYLYYDESRITQDEIESLLDDTGTVGYGRDASIGLGKFRVDEISQQPWPMQNEANAWLTLGPCAPQGTRDLDPGNSFYQPFTRFGRHGDVGVHLGNPFKTPVLLAKAGGIFRPKEYRQACFVGRGLGGDGRVSRAIPRTVQQGYAPVLPVKLMLA